MCKVCPNGGPVWLSIVAYMVRAGVMLGLVETEPQTPESRAYLRAHHALLWLRTHLADCQLLECQPEFLELRRHGEELQIAGTGQHLRMQGRPHTPLNLRLAREAAEQTEYALGPQGWVRFDYDEGWLKVELQAGDDSLGSLGSYPCQIRIRLPRTTDRSPSTREPL